MNDGVGIDYDCVIVPDATKKAAPIGQGIFRGADKFCGANLVTVNSVATDATVCSMSVPFMIRFVSDGFEFFLEDMNGGDGFHIFYEQFKC